MVNSSKASSRAWPVWPRSGGKTAHTVVSAVSTHSFCRCYGPCYIASDLASGWESDASSRSTVLRPPRPGQDRVSTLKNRILLENYVFSDDLEAQVVAFVDHYNHRRYHESISNLTPADVNVGRGQTRLVETRKDQTRHNQTALIATSAPSRLNQQTDGPETPILPKLICLKSFDDGQPKRARIFLPHAVGSRI